MGAPFSLLGKPVAFARDYPREEMPGGYMWDLVDYVPSLVAAQLTGRGGWTWASTLLPSSYQVQHGILATFFSGDRLIVEGSVDLSTHGRFYDVLQASPFTATDIGPAAPSMQNMLQLGQEVISIASQGDFGPQVILVLDDNVTLAVVPAWTAEIPPRRACVYKAMLAYGSGCPPTSKEIELRTVRFSVPGESLIDSTKGTKHETRTITSVGTYGATGSGLGLSSALTYAHHGPTTQGDITSPTSPGSLDGATVIDDGGATTTLAKPSTAGDTNIKLSGYRAVDGSKFPDGATINGFTPGHTVEIDTGQNLNSFDLRSFQITSEEITGLAATRSMVIVFHKGSTERIRGTTPPYSVPAGASAADVLAAEGDLILEPLFDDIGCLEPKTIAYWNDNVLFANERGVYMTDGATALNLCSQGGILTYWRDVYADHKSVAGAKFLDYYIVTIIHNSGASTTLICNIPSRQWFRFTNISALTYIGSGTEADVERLWAGIAGTSRLGQIAPCFFPTLDSALLVDANGTNVLPVFETPYYRLVFARALGHRLVQEEGRSRIRFGYLSYDARGNGSPPLAVHYLLTPESSYVPSDDSAVLPSTTDYTRFRFPVNKFPFGIAFRVKQIAATKSTRIFDLGVDSQPSERSRL